MLLYSIDPNFDHLKLKRTPEVEQAYEIHKKELQEKGITLEEYISAHEFRSSKQTISITPNNYPLELEEGQIEMLMWDKTPETKNELIGPMDHRDAVKHIFKCFEFGSVIAIWINSNEDQSVKGIRHYHFIIQE